jgi:hypothetical protein
VFERCGNTFLGFYTDFGDFRNVLVENNRFTGVADSYWTSQMGYKDGYSCSLVFRYNTYDTRSGVNAPPLLNCGAGNTQIYGNIFTQSPAQGGVGCQIPGSWTYNVFESTASGGNCGSGVAVADAGYVSRSGGDYHLTSESPAIGKGDPSRFPSTDIDGTARTSPPDAGFDER